MATAPYLTCYNSISSFAASQSFTCQAAAAVGDTVVVCANNNSGEAISNIKDSASNTYTAAQGETGSPILAVYYCLKLTTALTTSSTFTITNAAAASGGESLIAVGMTTNQVLGNDPAVFYSSGGTGTPSLASGAFSTKTQWVVGITANGNGGGTPTPNAPFANMSFQHPGSNQVLTLASCLFDGPSVTFAPTLTAAAVTCALISFPIPAWALPQQVHERQLVGAGAGHTSAYFGR